MPAPLEPIGSKKREIGECTLQEAVRIQVKAAVKAKEIMAAQGREVAVAIDLAFWENFLSLWERCLLKMHTMHSAR